ncbi:MAG TPA: FAD-dependent oxidoreductase [Microthrixaceae bacterium]|nr:FAD-dependent oxidoreductase [Microthrixaceae bacterium]
MDHIAIVGASLAGLSAAEAVRGAGFGGTLTVLDAAPEIPSDRPPLSKQVLAGTMAPHDARLPQASVLEDLDLDLRLGVGATGFSAADRTLHLSDGSTLTADGIVLATGGTPRRLPDAIGGSLEGVHVLRDLDHCLAIREDLGRAPRRVVVIGAGFIGAEVASTSRELGLEVSMVEALPLPMQRVLPGEIGGFVAEVHRDHGVDVRLGVGVAALEGGDRVERVRLTDGSTLDADVVVVGVGVSPTVDWLEGSGLTLDDGIVCDATCRAAPGVVAAGDLARWPNERYGEVMRVEQWEHAIEQGTHAGRRLVAGDTGEVFAPIPWFWSDQYDRKIQVAGRVGPDDEVRVVVGSIEERRFVAMFRRGDRCTAVLGVNRPAQVIRARMRMGEPGGLAWSDALTLYE